MKIRRKKFNSFPFAERAREVFLVFSPLDYGLQFFTTHRTLLSLSMDMKMSKDLKGWATRTHSARQKEAKSEKLMISLHFYC